MQRDKQPSQKKRLPSHREEVAFPAHNPLTLRACPFQTPHNRRQRFLLWGNATQPITNIEVEPELSSRYQIPAAASLPIQTPFRLKILHFNDLHGRMSHLTEMGCSPIFSRIVSRYKHQWQKYYDNPQGGVMLLSAGDDMVGTPFDILMANQNHPYELYQELGVDVATLGNHDLDLGTHTLSQIIGRAQNFPVLSANLYVPAPLKSQVHPAALIDIKGVRVGIIGLTTTAQMKSAEAKLLQFADPVDVVNNLLPVLRPYCHVLIILSHLGYDLHATSATVEGYGDRQLAEALPYGAVDAIIGGHTHHVLNETGLNHKNIVNGIPIMQAGAMGRFIGEVTLTLQSQHTVTVTNAKLTTTADLPIDQPFETNYVEPVVQSLKHKLNQSLGIVEPHPDLGIDAVLNDFASRELAIANFVTAGLLTQVKAQGYGVDLAMTDAAILKTGLPKGTLTYADWFALMPYADTLTLFQLTGEQLWQFLLDNARRANRPGEPHLERGFIQFSTQIRYTIHLGADRHSTSISDVWVGNHPLQDQLGKTLTIVSHSFLRQTALPWEHLSALEGFAPVKLDNLPTKDTNLLLRETLATYVKKQGGIAAAGGLLTDNRLQIRD
ncbi:bifunctional metallophosphatase/5'-nucleotidase [[Limnothrix rosea] IAM M-220]|uniref:bifunctional metallophosphatase/5'-nucleotidase n=1 Tax=[Limnothrix rosea] IAM M-220 TaxID=454133 RepID=UPI00095E7F0A|nr:bifunctional UDP-sugar hydrolase/5'-nucleotidase [[Limnothrix rosea] IAM M-220]OKH17977.1 serine/threonine protein phosphatase [[Limnothrix rosea] IAM M-220]